MGCVIYIFKQGVWGLHAWFNTADKRLRVKGNRVHFAPSNSMLLLFTPAASMLKILLPNDMTLRACFSTCAISNYLDIVLHGLMLLLIVDKAIVLPLNTKEAVISMQVCSKGLLCIIS